MGEVAEGWGLEKREKKEEGDRDERKTSVLSSKLIKTCNCKTAGRNMKDCISSGVLLTNIPRLFLNKVFPNKGLSRYVTKQKKYQYHSCMN